jgi:hypothetical protein
MPTTHLLVAVGEGYSRQPGPTLCRRPIWQLCPQARLTCEADQLGANRLLEHRPTEGSALGFAQRLNLLASQYVQCISLLAIGKMDSPHSTKANK